jgi:hypothetical protein
MSSINTFPKQNTSFAQDTIAPPAHQSIKLLLSARDGKIHHYSKQPHFQNSKIPASYASCCRKKIGDAQNTIPNIKFYRVLTWVTLIIWSAATKSQNITQPISTNSS